MTLEEMQKKAHQTATEKGFWEGKDPVKNLPEAIALMHSELSEALEELRKPGSDARLVYFTKDGKGVGLPAPLSDENNLALAMAGYKLEGVASEFADVVIRIMDNMEKLGLDLATAIRIKMAYNKTRPHKHGGKNF